MKNRTQTVVEATNDAATAVFSQTQRDLIAAVLIVSLTVNLFVLVGWVTLQVTSAYDAQVVSFLFVR